MGRWDQILDQKPQELSDYVLGKVADQLVEDLRNFPPRIAEWVDAALEARYEKVLTRVGRPELDTYRQKVDLLAEQCRLIGRDPKEMTDALIAFRAGTRESTVMGRIAKGFDTAELGAIATWWAAQK